MAQVPVRNGGFEKWKTVSNQQVPLDWSVSTVAALHHSPADSAREGKKALVLSTWYSYVEGHLFYGNHQKPNHRNWMAHTVPFASKPRELQGWYKYTHTVNPDDSAAGRIIIKDSNEDSLAYGQVFFAPTDTWTLFRIPLMYFSEKTPKKIAIYFTSAVAGRGMNDDSYPNRLYLDGIKFIYKKNE